MKTTDRIKPVGHNLLIIDDSHPERGGARIDPNVMEQESLSCNARGIYVCLVFEFLKEGGLPVLVKDLISGRKDKPGPSLSALNELEKHGHVKVL